MRLPTHLKKLLDTPQKRKKLNNIIKKFALKEKREMRKKGFILKGNKYIKAKR